MWCWTTGCAGLAVAPGVLVSGCGGARGATSDKLAALQRGMSYEETSAIMGCPAQTIARHQDDGVKTMEWTGPGSIVTATDLDFRDDRLLYYTTRSKSGF